MSLFDKLKAWLGVKPPANDATVDESGTEDSALSPAKSTSRDAPPPKPDQKARKQKPAKTPKPARRTTPKLDAELEAEARALFAKGDDGAAVAWLVEHTIMFARHEPSPSLPCLCQECLPARAQAESAGVAFVRDFVVTRHRAFFYWMPAELAAEAKPMRASMRAAVRERLRLRARKLDEPRETINPFTKAPTIIEPKKPRKAINPFTGKRVP